MTKEFQQVQWDEQLAADWQKLLEFALAEDLEDTGDWTTASLVPEDATGRAVVAARQPGIVAGLPGIAMTLTEVDLDLRWDPAVADGDQVEKGDVIGEISGPARGMLVAERLILNFIGRMSGIATLTRTFVDAIEGTGARIYDTRKTTPGWRRLEKYAVRQGGGTNHRCGLYEAVLIKDNHLALGETSDELDARYTPAQAVQIAREFIARHIDPPDEDVMTDDVMTGQIAASDAMIVEIEVDSLEQLAEVLPVEPDIVLLDNMRPAMLRKAVTMRDEVAPEVQLEASGGITRRTIRKIAESGVERISLGALTHSSVQLDFGLDWLYE